MMPSRIAELPDMPPSHSAMEFISEVSGRPRNRNISRPTPTEATSGTMTTGISDASQRGTASDVSHRAIRPAMMPVTRPPRKPAPMATEIAPPMKPGAMPGRPARP